MKTPSTSQVREWARKRGVPVGDRGRLPADLVAQYLAAHDSSARPAAGTSRPAPGPARSPAARASSDEVVIGRTVTAKPRWDWKR